MTLRGVLSTLFALMYISSACAIEQGSNSFIEQQGKEILELKKRLKILEEKVNAIETKKGYQSNVLNDPISEGLDQDIGRHEADKPVLLSGATNEKSEYDLALALLKNDKFSEAEKRFAEFIKRHPRHRLSENALFWYAECFYLQNNYNQAAVNYLKSYKEHPKGAKAADSLLKLSLSLGSLKKNKEACDIINKLDTEFPNRSETSVKRSEEAKNKFGCKK